MLRWYHSYRYLVVVNHLSMSFFISKDSLEVTVSVPASYQPVAVTFLINHSIWPIRAWWRFDKSKFQPEQGLIAPPGLDFGCKEWLQIARLWAEVISTICELLTSHTHKFGLKLLQQKVYIYICDIFFQNDRAWFLTMGYTFCALPLCNGPDLCNSWMSAFVIFDPPGARMDAS